MVAMIVMVFLVGALIGVLAGGAICVRYLRQEMTADISPALRRLQLKLDNMEAELNLALVTRLVDQSRGYPQDPTLPGSK
jgi:hypothetical protein